MNKYDKETIRAYLLGKISDDETLAGIEESLFTDDEFAAEIELVEDEIMNDYVLGKLSAEDAGRAESFFFNTAERKFKLKLTQGLKAKAKGGERSSFFESLKLFFRQPALAGAFAVLLVFAILLSIFLFRDKNTSELAKLQNIYKRERPVEPRISEFEYAPLGTTRGAGEDQENINKLRRIENALLDAVEKDASAASRRNLGVFYLTQRKFDNAIRELEKAFEADPKNAKIANDLGSAYFESAQGRWDIFAKANEKFSRAAELDPNLLEALFNKALCEQQVELYNDAKESWTLYLEKDPNSGWADEARRNLQALENLKTSSKTKEQVLDDFLRAFQNGDRETAWKINCQTKEMIAGVWLPDQLSRQILEAGIENDDGKEHKAIEALTFIGNLEKERNADFFVADLAEYYSKIDKSQAETLLKAKDAMRAGYETVEKTRYKQAVLVFEEARQLMANAGNSLEEKLADFWIAQCKNRNRKIAESERILSSLSDFCKRKNYRWLYVQILLWLADNAFLQTEFSKIIAHCKEALKISEKISDSYSIQKSSGCLANAYNTIGELNQSKIYLSKSFTAGDLYYSSRHQMRRNYGFLTTFFDLKQMPATAAGFGREGLTYARESPSDAKISSLIRLANIYGRKKDFSGALDLANESKDLALALEESEFKQTRIANSILKIADLKREMGDCAAALSEYANALQIFSQMKETKINLYETRKGRLLCYKALNRAEDLQAELGIVLNLSEEYRSKILSDVDRQAFFDNEQNVYDAAIENALSNGDAVKAFDFAESSKARSLLDFIAGNNSIAELEKQFSGVSKPLSLAEIQARMPENVQIVQLAVLQEKTAVWILTRGEIKTVELSITEEDLEKKIAGFSKLIIARAPKAEIEISGKELYDIIIKPLLPALDPSKDICLVSDKALHQLPFAALTSEGGKFLVEDFKIFSAPSVSVFIFATERAREMEKSANERLLSVGNPAFDRDENAGLPALPAADEEARAIAKFYPDAKRFSGADATREKFLAEMPSAEIVHFAGHYVAAETPQFSKLLFAGGDLRSFEIAETRLPRSKLVVLSACQTGIEKFYKGEGAIGIARTFLAIGTPLVVASRWKVDSGATRDLMTKFHRNRREKNLPTIEALRAAQIEMLRGEDEYFRQPYFWSAFSLIGAAANY